MKQRTLKLSGLAKWAIRQSLGTSRGNEVITVIDKILNIANTAGDVSTIGNVTETLDNQTETTHTFYVTIDNTKDD